MLLQNARGSGARGRGNRDNGGGNRQRRDRNDYPRDGVRKVRSLHGELI